MDDLESLVKRFQDAKTLEERLSISDLILDEIAPSLKAFVVNKAKAVDRMELADDLLQETLIRVFKRLPTFQGKTGRAFWGWCYQIARHLLIDALRSPQFREGEPLDFEDLEKALASSEKTTPLREGERADLEFALNLLRASKPECAVLLWNHYVLGWTYAESGNMFGLPEDGARMRIKRCLDRVRVLVEEKGERR